MESHRPRPYWGGISAKLRQVRGLLRRWIKEEFMIMKSAIAVVTVLILSGFNGFPEAGATESRETMSSNSICDRECLSGFITQYLDAMIAHKPDLLPVATNARFTEDCREMNLGEGLWKSISRLRDYRRDILEVREGVAISVISLLSRKAIPRFFSSCDSRSSTRKSPKSRRWRFGTKKRGCSSIRKTFKP